MANFEELKNKHCFIKFKEETGPYDYLCAYFVELIPIGNSAYLHFKAQHIGDESITEYFIPLENINLLKTFHKRDLETFKHKSYKEIMEELSNNNE